MGIGQLNQSRGKNFFYEKRLEYTEKLYADASWKSCHSVVQVNLDEQRKRLFLIPSGANVDNGEPSVKRPKTFKNNVKDLLDIFTENFLTAFSKHLAVLHLRARNADLNIQTLNIEVRINYGRNRRRLDRWGYFGKFGG